MSEEIDKIEGICQDCVYLNKIMPVIEQLQQENKELKEKNKKIKFENTYTNIVHNAFQTEKKEKRYYVNILTEIEKWLEEQNVRDLNENFVVIKLADIKNKIQELKGE